MVVFKILNLLVGLINNLAVGLPDIEKAAKDLKQNKKELQEAAKKEEVSIDQEVSKQICILESDLEKSIALARKYVSACISMAQYATEQKLAQTIKGELTQGKYDTMKSFLDIFWRKLKGCTKLLNMYEKSQDDLASKARDCTDKWHTKADEKSVLAQNKTMTLRSASFQEPCAKATNVLFIIIVFSCVGYFFLKYGADMHDRITNGFIVAVLCMASLIVLSYVMQLYCAYKKDQVADSFIEHKKEQKMFEEAIQIVENLKKLILENKRAIDEMKRKTEEATTALNNIVKNYLNPAVVPNLAEIGDIQNSYDDFRSSLDYLLNRVGPNEYSSADPMRIFSNTIPTQETASDTDGEHKMMLDDSRLLNLDCRDKRSVPIESIGGLSRVVATHTPSTRSQVSDKDKLDYKLDL